MNASLPMPDWSPVVYLFVLLAVLVVVALAATGTISAVSTGDSEQNASAAPNATFDVPPEVEARTPVTIDASASDPGDDDEIVEYIWQFTTSEDTITTATPTYEHTFDEAGPAGISLEIVTGDDRRATATEPIDVTEPSLTIEGEVVYDDGGGASGSIRLFDDNEEVAATETSTDGSFALSPDSAGTYDLGYTSTDLSSGVPDATSNGYADLYAIESVTVDRDATGATVDVGTVTLPASHEVETIVSNESWRGVEGADVTYTHTNNGATISHQLSTDENGRAPASAFRTLELSGTVDIEVEPPGSGFADETYDETLFVYEDTTHLVRLSEGIDVALEAEPNPVQVGENLTVDLNETIGTAESIAWTVDGRSTTDSDNRSLERQIDQADDFEVSVEVTDPLGVTTIETVDIRVEEPDRELTLETPAALSTHETFPVTATHEVEGLNRSLETFEWELRDGYGRLVDSTTTNSSSTDFEVESLGRYTIELDVTNEYGGTASTESTIDVNSVPSWATGSSHVEIDRITVPVEVEPGETVPVEVTATNTGDVPDLVDVTLKNDTDTVDRKVLELRDGETDTAVLTETAPERHGTYTLTVSTDDDHIEGAYTVTNDPSNASATNESASTDDDPAKLDLLPTASLSSIGSAVGTGSPPQNWVRNVLLGGVATAILSGVALIGYVVSAELHRDDRESTAASIESSDHR